MYQAIKTAFHGPTNHQGARVSAVAEAGKATVAWDYALGVEGNHLAAARALAEKLDWDGEWIGGGLPGSGYCFVSLRGMTMGTGYGFTVEPKAAA